MGCWGMGITQSDEYCDVYERFMEEYDEGKPVFNIKKIFLMNIWKNLMKMMGFFMMFILP